MPGLEDTCRGIPRKDDGGNGPSALPSTPIGVAVQVSLTLLGATFLGIGYALSSLSRRASGAAGLAIGLWLGLVVLYDLARLAAVVADDGGTFTRQVFPAALLANPADAFRLFNLSASQATVAASGIGGAAASIAL